MRRLKRRLIRPGSPSPIVGDHIVQLFDTDESLTRSVAAFLESGLENGQSLLVLATPQHWEGILSELYAQPDADPVCTGRLAFLDAEEVLGRFMRGGEPSRALFEHAVAPLVIRRATGARGGLRIYGEMVELLAREGNYKAAARVEQFWNDLGTRCPFTLLCGYSAAHFAAPDAGSALRVICRQHSQALSRHTDPLGEFLLASEEGRPTSLPVGG